MVSVPQAAVQIQQVQVFQQAAQKNAEGGGGVRVEVPDQLPLLAGQPGLRVGLSGKLGGLRLRAEQQQKQDGGKQHGPSSQSKSSSRSSTASSSGRAATRQSSPPPSSSSFASADCPAS